ncbi:hypothetical protein POM88_002151 [Heracleum sosnowskyi]|uniref:Uncharacterized protein n=1 Tax=Heracleum sosnowskyi TaxID=360622 RepID=A0AAD8JF33_9APIA|nr:hypothetical protein POM88_002151 [Heracleum sosnowskyi]
MEAKMYLGNEKFPNRMLSLQCSNTSNLESASGEEDATRDEEIPKNLNLRSYPFEVGGLQIRSLGKILKDSELLYDCNYSENFLSYQMLWELELDDGTLWYCNLCRDGAAQPTPPCWLCPVTG